MEKTPAAVTSRGTSSARRLTRSVVVGGEGAYMEREALLAEPVRIVHTAAAAPLGRDAPASLLPPLSTSTWFCSAALIAVSRYHHSGGSVTSPRDVGVSSGVEQGALGAVTVHTGASRGVMGIDG